MTSLVRLLVWFSRICFIHVTTATSSTSKTKDVIVQDLSSWNGNKVYRGLLEENIWAENAQYYFNGQLQELPSTSVYKKATSSETIFAFFESDDDYIPNAVLQRDNTRRRRVGEEEWERIKSDNVENNDRLFLSPNAGGNVFNWIFKFSESRITFLHRALSVVKHTRNLLMWPLSFILSCLFSDEPNPQCLEVGMKEVNIALVYDHTICKEKGSSREEIDEELIELLAKSKEIFEKRYCIDLRYSYIEGWCDGDPQNSPFHGPSQLSSSGCSEYGALDEFKKVFNLCRYEVNRSIAIYLRGEFNDGYKGCAYAGSVCERCDSYIVMSPDVICSLTPTRLFSTSMFVHEVAHVLGGKHKDVTDSSGVICSLDWMCSETTYFSLIQAKHFNDVTRKAITNNLSETYDGSICKDYSNRMFSLFDDTSTFFNARFNNHQESLLSHDDMGPTEIKKTD